MAHTDRHRAVRLPDDLHRRAEALIPKLEGLWPIVAGTTPAGRAVQRSTAAVLRVATERGLSLLEAEAALAAEALADSEG